MIELLNNLALGFSVAMSPANLMYAFIGCLLGTAIGVLPGIGPLTTIALLLPLTYTLTPVSALIMLAGIYYGAQYGGSTTAILIRVPGEASSVVTSIDGYQMSLNGRAGPALATAALGSFVAGCVATVVMAAFAAPMTRLALEFGPAEYFSLMVFGLVGAAVLTSGSLVKAVAMILVGILIGTIGIDVGTGDWRFTFNVPELLEGLDFVPIGMGIFGIGEIIRNLTSPEPLDRPIARKIQGLIPSLTDFRLMFPAILRGAGLGCVLGILPGGGALLSSFTSYTVEKKIRLQPGEVPFGKGNIRGVAGPESANNAGAQTAFIPLLTLGIPSNPVLAMMIGAMTIHNIQPGPRVITTNPDLFWGVIASMWVGNLMLVILNLPLIGIWVRMLAVPYRLLFPAIVLFCLVGAYSVGNSAFNVWILAIFGIIGIVLFKLDCEPAPLLLGLVLGSTLEDNLRRALSISHGDWSVFVTRPISAILLVLAAVLLVIIVSPSIRARRKEAFTEG